MAIYRGHFLGDSSVPWAIPAREKLRNKFLFCLEKFGKVLEEKQQWQRAVDWYRRGLEMDILAEQFYQRLMYCYEQLDRKSDAVEVYRQCHRVLSASLDVEPSKKTKEIYAQVRA